MLEITSLGQLLSLIRGNNILVVAFYADWCGPCQIVKPQFASMSELFNTVKFCRCNIDRNREAASRFGVRSIPTFIVWTAGELNTTINGGQMGNLQRVIEQAIERYPSRNTGINSNSNANISSDASSSSVHSALALHMKELAQIVSSSSSREKDTSSEKKVCETIYAIIQKDCTRKPIGIVLLPYFATNGFNAAAVDALFTYIASQPEPRCHDGEYIVNEILGHLIEFFLSTTFSNSKELKMLRQVLYSLVSCNSILPIIVRSHLFYNDALSNGLQLEYGTILGAMLGVCPYSRSYRPFPPYSRTVEWEQLMKIFPADMDDHSQKINEFHLFMETACYENKRIIIELLKSKSSRDATLRFIGAALRLNSSYTKTMHQNLPLSSRYFMVQLNDVLIEATLPLFGKGYNPNSISSSYVLEDNNDNTVVDFGDDVERITHYDENRPLPPFPTLQEPFKPTVHLFFLAARSITLSAAVLIEIHQRHEQEVAHPRMPPEHRAAYIADKCLIEGLLGSENLGRKRVQVLNGIAGWLVNVMNVSPEGVLSKEPPKEWEYLPQELVDVVIRGIQLAPLEYFDVENIISLMLALMGNTTYFPKPHTHALFPAFLARLMQSEDTNRALTSHRWFTQNVVRCCVLCYIAVEKSTYEKVNVRYTLSYCTKSFLKFDSLCEPVRQEFESDGTILERFSHMVTADVNEAVDQLIETLIQMNRLIKEGADLSENARPLRNETSNEEANNRGTNTRGRNNNNNRNNEEEGEEDDEDNHDDGESPLTYHQLGLGLRQRILLFEASMDLFIQLASRFSKGVAQNMVAQQIGQMLARSLLSFAGAESKNLKIENPERYNFRPREILTRLVDCFAQFRRFQNFLRALCNCGVPLKNILQAMQTITERGLVAEHLVWKLKELAAALESISREVNEDDALWDDAPEYALDALLSTPLLHPVALPADVKDLNDLVYVNEDTIHHVLLSESKHPFTKEYLDEKMVKEFNARDDITKARNKLQDRISAWLEEAKKSH